MRVSPPIHLCIKSSFSIALICTTSRRIPASASTNQGPEKCSLIQAGQRTATRGTRSHAFRRADGTSARARERESESESESESERKRESEIERERARSRARERNRERDRVREREREKEREKDHAVTRGWSICKPSPLIPHPPSLNRETSLSMVPLQTRNLKPSSLIFFFFFITLKPRVE